MPTIKNIFWSPGDYPNLHKKTYVVDNDAMVDPVLALLTSKDEKSYVGLDSETTGLDPQMRPVRTRLLQLCVGDIVAVFDLFKLRRDSIDRIGVWLASAKRVKIIHNAKFDGKFLSFDLGFPEMAPLFDTQLAAQLLDLGDKYGKHDLGYCLSHFIGVQVFKDISHGWTGDLTPRQIIYASNDAAHLPELREEMLKRGKEAGLLSAFKVEFEAVWPTVAMELAGFKLDTTKWNKVTAKTRQRLFEVQDKLMAALPVKAGDTPGLFPGISHFKANSDEVIKERLKAVGIVLPTVTKETADGGEVEVETVLSEKLAEVAGQHEALPLVIEYGMLSTSVSSYGKKFLRYINPHDHRLHADFKQIGTVTARYSAKQPPLHGIPKKSEHRECFISEPGWRLVWADYSQIELRILAEMCKDPKLIQVFRDGKDLHEFTASELFGIDPNLISEVQRRRAKDLNFGEVYGVGVKRFAQKAGISVQEAKRLLEKLQTTYPIKATYLNNASIQAMHRGWCRTMSGKLITFHFDRSKPKQTSAVGRHGKNYPIQGSSADITKTALRMVYDDIDRNNAKIVNCVHDEIVLEVREEHVASQSTMLRAAMVRAGESFLKEVPVVVDVEVNDFWRKKKAE